VGNEVEGVSRTVLDMCDDIIEIPMQGEKESLNVSVSTGIALYALMVN
jgi:tRNA G18 (ribose-2'-O)-methylase SpoU